MKKYIKILSLLSILAVTNVQAEGEKSLVYVIDPVKLSESKLAQDLKNKLEANHPEKNKSLEADYSSFEKQVQDFQKQLSLLNEQAKAKKNKELDKLKQDLIQKQQTISNKFSEAAVKANQQYEKVVKDILSNLAKEYGAKLILNSLQVPYYSEEIDLSDRVVKELDKKLTKIDFNM